MKWANIITFNTWICIIVMLNSVDLKQLDNVPRIALFSGHGYILNKLTNRPITSTEEKVEIEFQTKQSNTTLFCAGSETELLRLDIINGLLRVFLHLPISEMGLPMNSLGESQEGVLSYVKQKSKLSSLFQLDVVIQSHLDPASRLDDNQWHYVILERSNSMLQVYIDNDLVFTRLISSLDQYAYLLHTQVLVLGGSYKLGDIFQVNSINAGSDTNFIGIMSKAIFQADALDMNILKFTVSGLHGFRIYPVTKSNASIHQTADKIHDNAMEAVQFITICDLLKLTNNLNASPVSFNSDADTENAYISLKLPTITVTNMLQSSFDCMQQTNRSITKTQTKLRWIDLEIDFKLLNKEQNANGLLFLLRDDTDNRVKHFKSVNNDRYGEQIFKDYEYQYHELDGSSLIGAEFRNSTLHIIIQKSKTIWFEVEMNSPRTLSMNSMHTLEIKYTFIWLPSENDTRKIIWPLVKVRYDSAQEWIVIGPNSQKRLGVITLEQELNLERNFYTLNSLYNTVWQNTLWFGRTLYLGGINYTKSIETGVYIPGLLNINGIRQHFQGCIFRLAVNGLVLDLQSAVKARNRYLQSSAQKKQRTFPVTISKSNCENDSPSQELPNNCLSETVNRMSCPIEKRLQWKWKPPNLCRCHSHDFEAFDFQNGTPILHFNGLQLIRLQFPVQQYSPLLWIQFMFKTNHLNGTILYTVAKSQYVETMMKNIVDPSVEGKPSLEYTQKLYFRKLQQQQQREEKLANSDNSKYSTSNYQGYQIFLLNGYIHVKLFIGKNKAAVELPVYISDGKWHSYELIHNDSHISISLDEHQYQHRTNSTISQLPIQQIIIGSDKNSPESNKVTGYTGEIAYFLYNGIELLPYDNNGGIDQHSFNSSPGTLPQYSLNKWILEFEAQLLQYRKESKPIMTYDYPVQFMRSNCYLSLFNRSIDPELAIKFYFKSSFHKGILLFILNKFQNDSFILIELFNGQIYFSVNFNNELVTTNTVESNVLFNDSKWHTVEVFRSPKENNVIIFRVDTETTMETITSARLSNFFNTEEFISNSIINIGGSSTSDLMRFRGKIKSRTGFQGCMANFQLNSEPTIALLQSAQILPSDECSYQIVSGCEFESSSCALTNRRHIYSYEPTFYDLDIRKELVSLNTCYNQGKCLKQMDKFYCACDLTTFQGHRCNEAGTTLHFGKVGSISHLFNLNETLTELKQHIGFVYFQIKTNGMLKTPTTTSSDAVVEVFSLGIQLDLIMTENSDRYEAANDFITLLYASSGEKIDLTYLHVYLEKGYLKMKFHLDGSVIVIDGPKVNLQDGYYHRIRGIRSSNQVLLEVDQYHTIYRLYNEFSSLMKIQHIWLGHSPISNRSDFIRGYLSGVYYNGLLLTDLAAGIKHLTFVKVIRYLEVEHIGRFQLKLGPNSPFYIDFNPRKEKKQVLSKSQLSFYTPNVITSDTSDNSNLSILKPENCPSCFSRKDHYWNQPTVSNQSNALLTSKFHPTVFKPSYSINIWLFVCLILTGIILISSFGFLIYRCAQHQCVEDYANHLQHSEDFNLSNETNLMKSDNTQISDNHNKHIPQQKQQQQLPAYTNQHCTSLCQTRNNENRYNVNSKPTTAFLIDNFQYIESKNDSDKICLPTVRHSDSEDPLKVSKMNMTFREDDTHHGEIDNFKLGKYEKLPNCSTMKFQQTSMKYPNFFTYNPRKHNVSEANLTNFTFLQNTQAM
ncbi:unnamed protein product [Trichobilharzia szidati]|nr:unnamed protein product [Trichobilharzia szidati]